MRKLDSKYHLEGEQIIKTSNGEPIPEDEPVFILRARDRLATPLLQQYQRLCLQDGCNPYHIKSLNETRRAFEDFAATHPDRMRQPGCTMGR